MPNSIMSNLIDRSHRVRNTIVFVGIIIGIAALVIFLG
jgi:hypothetical protein